MSDLQDFAQVIAFDENGLPVPAAQAFFFLSGTTTPAVVYTDQAQTIPHPSPLLANAAGVFPLVWSTVELKADVKDPSGASLPGYPVDPVRRSLGQVSAASAVTFSPIGDLTAGNVQAAIEQGYNLLDAQDAILDARLDALIFLDSAAALTDPGGNRVLGWDDTANAFAWFDAGQSMSLAANAVASVGFACRAWVTFAGATGVIAADANVDSVTRSGAGIYTVNFTDDAPNTNYVPSVLTDGGSIFGAYATRLVGSCQINTRNSAGTLVDPATVSVAFFW
jgi:hypothetical protein